MTGETQLHFTDGHIIRVIINARGWNRAACTSAMFKAGAQMARPWIRSVRRPPPIAMATVSPNGPRKCRPMATS
ncbi:hypothetical protein [uncultured Croceicoccus sp.]|uniref:hypothetical protein n=1 Tax=uncultured Croceicoccus sp. TaxID=1295329 RepID=UPI002604EA50|nr:hypothetical protein [uncultured Croceicoccus sp.]